MDLLTKDVLFSIATFLPLNDLISFCNSDSRINQLIYQRDDIWNFKLDKEFPDYKNQIEQRGREAYQLLVGLVKLKNIFKYSGTIYQLYKEKYLNLNGRGIKELFSEIGLLSNL